MCYVLVFQVHHCLRQIPVANGNAFSFVDPSWQILQFFHTLHLIHFLEQHQYPLFSSRSRDIMEKNDMDSVTRIIGHTQSLVSPSPTSLPHQVWSSYFADTASFIFLTTWAHFVEKIAFILTTVLVFSSLFVAKKESRKFDEDVVHLGEAFGECYKLLFLYRSTSGSGLSSGHLTN